MGNQQVTDFEFGWLSGIIDGEGCFTMSKGSRGSYNVGFKLVNTNLEIISKFCEILRKLRIEYHIYDAHRSGNQRPAKRVEINGPEKLRKALEILLPYLMAKKEQAILLSEYLQTKLNTPHGQMNPVYEQFVCTEMGQLKL